MKTKTDKRSGAVAANVHPEHTPGSRTPGSSTPGSRTPGSRQGLVAVKGRAELPSMFFARRPVSHDAFWRWGDDNMFPQALALMSRRSTIHRRIINDKADYVSGKGFSFDGAPDSRLARLVERANGSGETLREVLNRVAFDKALFGNAFLEIVTDRDHSFLSLHHQDASRCRVAKEGRAVILHHDWTHYKASDAVRLPLYPDFEVCPDGLLRSAVHYKDYEPTFLHYGVPSYIAGLNVSTIAYKTDKWNISRLDNSFQISGVMLLDSDTESEQQALEIIKAAERRFAGTPGQVMFMLKNSGRHNESQFVPISQSNEGDWKSLHDQATSDIVVAHSWFRSLSGLDYGGGFNSERILHEYEIALNTVILGEQAELLEPIRRVAGSVLRVDASSLQVVNRPPTKAKPDYMKVWEARKAEGLDYDPGDPTQQLYLGQIRKYNLKNAE